MHLREKAGRCVPSDVLCTRLRHWVPVLLDEEVVRANLPVPPVTSKVTHDQLRRAQQKTRYCIIYSDRTCSLYLAPLAAVDSVPKFHAHLSPFSLPALSYHALSSGSLPVSASSCANTEIMLSTPKSPFGVVVCGVQMTQTIALTSPLSGVEIEELLVRTIMIMMKLSIYERTPYA